MKSLIAKTFVLGVLVCGAVFALAPEAHAMREWDPANDPAIFLKTYYQRLGDLPTSGSVAAPLWSDTYWPSRYGGAAWRWQLGQQPGDHPDADPHVYGTFSVDELSQMSDEQLNTLSPAEKYDIVTGRFDFPTVGRERARTNPNLPKWFGLCHAVATVTSRYKEPQNRAFYVDFPNGIRRVLTFYSSDTKALLALAADQTIGSAFGMGRSCDRNPGPNPTGGCWDTNPASLYIVLANVIGFNHSTIIMDVDPGAEKWNAVVKDYSATITPRDEINENAAPGTVREVLVNMNVRHMLGAKPAPRPVGPLYKTELYTFTLELDRNDNIIGGEWISSNRPDQLWQTPDVLQLDPNLSFLQELVEPLRP